MEGGLRLGSRTLNLCDFRPGTGGGCRRAEAGNSKQRNKTMAKHMGPDERGRIEFMLDGGFAIAEIAKDIGRPESTVSREIQNRRIDSDKRYGCSNRLCARFDECQLTFFSGFANNLRKNMARCFDRCPKFFMASCERWAKGSHSEYRW